jgi:hypothetical protein
MQTLLPFGGIFFLLHYFFFITLTFLTIRRKSDKSLFNLGVLGSTLIYEHYTKFHLKVKREAVVKKQSFPSIPPCSPEPSIY